jgi:cytochrome b
MNPQAPASSAIRVWDLPTRLFHWALAVCVAGSLISIEIGGNAVGWHFRFGYAILTLLLFRLAWGFFGPRYARFSSFPPNPRATLDYLLGRSTHLAGHSPLAAWSVYALLLSLGFQVVTGLFANDAIMWDGPLRNRVSNDTSDWLTHLHESNRWVLLTLIGLHLAAIVAYRVLKRRNLVSAMIVGDARLVTGTRAPPAAADGWRQWLVALVLLGASAAAVRGLLTLG